MKSPADITELVRASNLHDARLGNERLYEKRIYEIGRVMAIVEWAERDVEIYRKYGAGKQ